MKARFTAFFVLSLAAMLGSPLAAEEKAAKTWNFEDAQLGQLPPGWTTAKTGEGPGSQWSIIEDATAPQGSKVLAQTSSEGPNPLFNLCVANGPSRADVDLSVSVRSVRGKLDRGGGPVWRYQDANNYYVCRVNPLEANFRVYHVVDGKRTQLASADSDPDAKGWQTIRVVHKGSHIQCYLDGKKLLDIRDNAIKAAGKVGFWTKADAVTSFDRLIVRSP